MKIILLLLSAISCLSFDSQNRGLSYIGMCHEGVRGEDILWAFQGRTTVSIHFLARTFNNTGCPSWEYISKDPRPMIVHLSLFNGPGLRNRRLQRHEVFYGFTIRTAEAAILRRDPKILNQIQSAAVEARTLLSQRENRPTVIRIKPILESNFNKKARRILFRHVRKVFPEAELIDNPLRDSCLTGTLCETHGMNTDGDILDLDGLDYDLADKDKWNREGEQKVGMFVWKFCNNGFRKNETWKPPLNRENWCGRQELRIFQKWLRA